MTACLAEVVVEGGRTRLGIGRALRQHLDLVRYGHATYAAIPSSLFRAILASVFPSCFAFGNWGWLGQLFARYAAPLTQLSLVTVPCYLALVSFPHARHLGTGAGLGQLAWAGHWCGSGFGFGQWCLASANCLLAPAGGGSGFGFGQWCLASANCLLAPASGGSGVGFGQWRLASANCLLAPASGVPLPFPWPVVP